MILELVDGLEVDAAQVALVHLVLGMPFLEVTQQVVARFEHGRAQMAQRFRFFFVVRASVQLTHLQIGVGQVAVVVVVFIVYVDVVVAVTAVVAFTIDHITFVVADVHFQYDYVSSTFSDLTTAFCIDTVVHEGGVRTEATEVAVVVAVITVTVAAVVTDDAAVTANGRIVHTVVDCAVVVIDVVIVVAVVIAVVIVVVVFNVLEFWHQSATIVRSRHVQCVTVHHVHVVYARRVQIHVVVFGILVLHSVVGVENAAYFAVTTENKKQNVTAGFIFLFFFFFFYNNLAVK